MRKTVFKLNRGTLTRARGAIGAASVRCVSLLVTASLLLTDTGCPNKGPEGTITEFPLPYTNVGCNIDALITGRNGKLWFSAVPANTGNWEIDQMTTSGAVTQFSLPPAPMGHFNLPGGLTNAPDGNVWFTLSFAIGRITPTGSVTTFPIPDQGGTSGDITLGPDGNLWFTLTQDNGIGRMTLSGNFTEFAVPTPNSEPSHIKVGPDGNLWFTEANLFNGHNIGRITTTGVITEFPAGSPFNPGHAGLTAGPDGQMWFAHAQSSIGEMTLAGSVTEIPLGSQNFASEIITGPDANLWFAEDDFDSSNPPGKHAIVKMTTAGSTTKFYPPSQGDPNLFPNYHSYLTRGPDGAVWFSEGVGSCQIARIATHEQPCEFALPAPFSFPTGITAGPDGNLWFTEGGTGAGGSKIGRITTQGVLTEFPTLTPASGPMGIVLGPDGNLWFTETFVDKIGRITPAGMMTEYPLPIGGADVRHITQGPDGNLWFTETVGQNIGRVTPSGVVTEFSLSSFGIGSGPQGITTGSDGNLWFLEDTSPSDTLVRMTPSGVMTQFPIPGGTNILPNEITAGPNGNLWFTNLAPNLDQVTTTGTFMSVFLPAGIGPHAITRGPDGNVWFTATRANAIGRITPSGIYTLFPLVSDRAFPAGITAGPDGNLWFTESRANKIGCIAP